MFYNAKLNPPDLSFLDQTNVFICMGKSNIETLYKKYLY